MTVEDVLTEATVLYLQQGKGHELEFISKSESSSLGWYFWLQGVDGVYEIEKKKELRPESREFYCDVIMDEASKMNQMVKNLLTLNQLEFGDEDIVFERFNLTALVKGVLQSMEIMADQAGAKIMLHTEEDIYAWADEFKVEQVVRNYVSNACHHVSGDMVIEVKMVQKDGKVRVSVFNTGNPIPEADAPHIWDKFYKVDKAHTREYGGNGIGLSIVKAIMKSFNQEYGVKNYDNGVEFWFELDVQ